MKVKATWIEEWRKRILDCNCFYEGQHEEINHLCDLAAQALAPEVERNQIIEKCAKAIEPQGDAPCGCLRPGSYGGCDCQNTGDLQQEDAYWSAKANAETVRSLKE